MPPPTRSRSVVPSSHRAWTNATATFRLAWFPQLWCSNLLQFMCVPAGLVIMQWLVTDSSDSRTAVGLLGFVQGAAIMLASPYAGVMVDRYRKRQMLLWARLGMTCTFVAMASLALYDATEYVYVLAAALFSGLLASLANPAAQTYVVDLVGHRNAHRAVAMNAVGAALGQNGGPAVAGLAIAVASIAGAYFGLGAFMAMSVVALLAIPATASPPPRPVAERHSAWRDMRDGLAYVGQRPALMLVLLCCSMALFNGAISPMRPIFARHVLDVGAQGLGGLSGAFTAGAVGTALLMMLYPLHRHFGLFIAASMLAYAVSLLLYSFAFSYTYLLFIELIMGSASQIWHIATFAGLQLFVAPQMRGRVLSMVFTVVQSSYIGVLAIGVLADAVGDQLALGIFGLIPTVALSLVLLFGWRTLRQLQPLPAESLDDRQDTVPSTAGAVDSPPPERPDRLPS